MITVDIDCTVPIVVTRMGAASSVATAATTVWAGADRGGAFVSAAVPKKMPRKKYPPPITTTRRTKNRRRFIDTPRWLKPGRHVDDLTPNPPELQGFPQPHPRPLCWFVDRRRSNLERTLVHCGRCKLESKIH